MVKDGIQSLKRFQSLIIGKISKSTLFIWYLMNKQKAIIILCQWSIYVLGSSESH